MKLLQQKSRAYKEKEYTKHWIVIPNDLIKQLKWKAGDDLKTEIDNDMLIIKKN
jgi:hypothetical protein